VKRLTVYSRPQCHLCELLLDELLPVAAGQAEVRVVDIDADPVLQERYWLRIPVVAGPDGELSEYPLDRNAVMAYLAA
jgi:hypothetical protein